MVPAGSTSSSDGLDDLFLGTVPVETEAVAGTISEQEVSVGNLVLEVVARQVAALLLGAGVAAASSPASPPVEEIPSAAITMRAPRVAPIEITPQQDSETLSSGDRPSELERRRLEIESAARASRSASSAASAGRVSRPAPSPDLESPLMERLSRAALWTAPLAVVLLATSVLLTMRTGRETEAPQTDAPPVAAAAPPAAQPSPFVPSTGGSERPIPKGTTAPTRTERAAETVLPRPVPSPVSQSPVPPSSPASPSGAAPMAMPSGGPVPPLPAMLSPGESLSSANLAGVTLTIRLNPTARRSKCSHRAGLRQ